jgi:hypothetical protein
MLATNTTHQLQWNLTRADNITITNGISLSTMQPYRAADYEILSNMLNKISTGKTVKDNLLVLLNKNYKDILTAKVRECQVHLAVSIDLKF